MPDLHFLLVEEHSQDRLLSLSGKKKNKQPSNSKRLFMNKCSLLCKEYESSRRRIPYTEN